MAEARPPLSVWPCAQRSGPAQRARRYLATSGTHPAKMLPALARRAIETYTAPGDVVVDPMCGIGTTLVEAVHLGRDAVGVEYEPEWAGLARANLAYAQSLGATGEGEVVVGDGRDVAALVDPALRGLVALVLTSPPYGPSLHGRVRTAPGQGVTKHHHRYSRDRRNLAHVDLASLFHAIGEILVSCTRVLRPDGLIAITTRPWRRAGHLLDLPGEVVRVAEHVGLALVERNVALLAGVRDSQVVPRASFFALDHARKASARGLPQLVIAHEDLLVFRLSGKSLSSEISKDPHGEPKRSAR